VADTRRARRSIAAERAIRAAAEPRQRLPRGFLVWVIGRVLGLAVLVGAGWIVYDSASSDRFQVRSVDVQGSLLLSRSDIERVAAVKGANVFWVNRAEVEARLRSLPMINHVEVHPYLPDRVDVRIVERQPVAFWISGEQSYLVDREGVILKAVDAEAQHARACAGQPCDPRLASLPTVAQRDGQPLRAGDRIDASALSTSARLATVLPRVGVQPLAFEWSPEAGLEVPTREGWRVRFDTQRDLEQQVRAAIAVRQHVASSGASATLIDVRFGDRPYFR
jgi:cell division septal protein FtsQ